MDPEAAAFIPSFDTVLATPFQLSMMAYQQERLHAEQSGMPQSEIGDSLRRDSFQSTTVPLNEPVDFSSLCRRLRVELQRTQHNLCLCQLNEIALEKQNAALKEEVDTLRQLLLSANINPTDPSLKEEDPASSLNRNESELRGSAGIANDLPKELAHELAESTRMPSVDQNFTRSDTCHTEENQSSLQDEKANSSTTPSQQTDQTQANAASSTLKQDELTDITTAVSDLNIAEPGNETSLSHNGVETPNTLKPRSRSTSNSTTDEEFFLATEPPPRPNHVTNENSHNQSPEPSGRITKLCADLMEARVESTRLNNLVTRIRQDLAEETTRAQYYQTKYTDSLITKHRADQRFERASETLQHTHAMLQHALDQWLAWRTRHIELVNIFGVKVIPDDEHGGGSEGVDVLVITEHGSGRAAVSKRKTQVVPRAERRRRDSGM